MKPWEQSWTREDEEQKAPWQRDWGVPRPHPKQTGILEDVTDIGSAAAEGVSGLGRNLKAFGQTLIGSNQGVEQTSRNAAIAAEQSNADSLKAFKADLAERMQTSNGSLMDGLRNVGSAIARNPSAVPQLIAEQLPNAAVTLGAGAAGFKAGAVAAPFLGPLAPLAPVVGGVLGMFLGNTAIETGSKAIEKGRDGFTDQERSDTLREGAVKGGVITAVDTATLGATKWLFSPVGKAMEQAGAKALTDLGVDVANREAVQAALADPAARATVEAATAAAFKATNGGVKGAARAGTALGLETVGEGVGEGLGEYAATGEYNPTDVVLESVAGLGQSAIEVGVGRAMAGVKSPRRAEIEAKGEEAAKRLETATSLDEITQAAADLAGSTQEFIDAAIESRTPTLDVNGLPSSRLALEEAGFPETPSTDINTSAVDRAVARLDSLAPAQTGDGIQVETGYSPRGDRYVDGRPLAEVDLNPEGAAARLSGVPAPEAPATPDLRAPRPSKIAGVAASSWTDEQLTEIATNETQPGITRRGAEIELAARRAEQRQRAPIETQRQQTPVVQDEIGQRLQAAATEATPATPEVDRRLETAAAAAPTPGPTMTEGGIALNSNRRGDAPALTVDAVHYSQQARPTLTTGNYGTGLQGSDRDEILNAADPRIKQRLSFYVNKGTGVRPESGVGGVAHRVQLTDVYDSDADPLRLKEGRGKREFESAVLDAGYKGYLTRMEGSQPGQVIMLGQQSFTPQVLGPRTRVDEVGTVPAPEAREQNAGDRILASKSLPSGAVAPQRWGQLIQKLDPQAHAEMAQAGVFEGTQPMYRDELVGKWRSASQGQVRNSNVRGVDSDPVLQSLQRQAEAAGGTVSLVTIDQLPKAGQQRTKQLPAAGGKTVTVREISQEEARAIEAFYAEKGARVVFYDSDALGDGSVLSSDPKTIRINRFTSKPAWTVAGHEAYHTLTAEERAAFEKVVRAQKRDDTDARFAEDYGPGADNEELSADLFGNALSRPEVVERAYQDLAATLPENKQRGAVTRMASSIRKIVKNIKRVVANQAGFRADEMVKDLNAIDRAAVDALKSWLSRTREERVALTESNVAPRETTAAPRQQQAPPVADVVEEEPIAAGDEDPLVDAYVATGSTREEAIRLAAEERAGAVRNTERRGNVEIHALNAVRGERVTADRTKVGADEKAIIREAAKKMGVPISEVEQMVRDHKAAHPVSDGWAALTLTGTKVDEATGKAELQYKTIPYGFNLGRDGKALEPGTPEYRGKVATIAQAMLREVQGVFTRAQAGDRAAQNIIAQSGWYKEMRTRLRQEFGGLGDLFADLLGATSPNTPVRTNWDNSVEALRLATTGAFDELLPKWIAWADNADAMNTRFRAYFQEMLDKGMSKAQIKATGEYKWLAERAAEARELPDALLPLKANGKKFGFNGQNVVRAMADLWRVVKDADPDIRLGGTAPKAINFSGNLIGFRQRATIDVWAARMLQRLAGLVRVPSMAEGGVTGEARRDGTNTLQFGFGQDVFTEATKMIRNDETLSQDDVLSRINDDDLQALVWFIEKEVWTKGNWTSAAGEGGSFEFEADLAGVADRDRVNELRRVADSSIASTAEQRAQAQADIERIQTEMAALPDIARANEMLARGEKAREGKLTKLQQEAIVRDNKVARDLIKKTKESKAYKALESELNRAKAVLKKPTVEERQATRAGALRSLSEISRPLDRFTAGISIQKGAEQGMAPTPPSDAEMARMAGRIRSAVLKGDPGASVVGLKAISSEGVYGAPERSLDLEAVVREDFDARPLAREVFTVAQEADQDAAFVARVLRPDEKFDPLLHRPGVEIYFRDMNQAQEAARMMAEIAGLRVGRTTDFGPGYFEVGGYTIIVDGRPTPGSRAGAMGKPVGMRVLYMPEFEARYGIDPRLENATDSELRSIVEERTDLLGEFANAVLEKFSGVSFAGRFNYEVETRFAGEYQGAIDGYADGGAAEGTRAGQGKTWAGRSVRESVAAAVGRVSVDGGQPRAELPGRDGAEEGLTRNSARRQTDTPEFKRWFGDSKVVDENGVPLVVYHGTDAEDFNGFLPGAFFSTNPSEAGAYAKTNELRARSKGEQRYRIVPAPASLVGTRVPYSGTLSDFDDAAPGDVVATDNGVFRRRKGGWDAFGDLDVEYGSSGGGDTIRVVAGDGEAAREYVADYADYLDRNFPGGSGGRVLPVYLSIKNPVRLSPLQANRLGMRLGASREDIQRAIEKYEAEGYDGIVTESDEASMFPEVAEGLGGVPTHYIAFRPEQIKSAIGNRGTFSPTDPDIRNSSRRGQVDTPEFKKWFGDSKVVDENGEPLVVYHGSKNSSITSFDFKPRGFTSLTSEPSKSMPGWEDVRGTYIRDGQRHLIAQWMSADDKVIVKQGHGLTVLDTRGRSPKAIVFSYMNPRTPTSDRVAAGHRAAFFSEDPEYTGFYSVWGARDSEDTPVTYPVYLRIENPVLPEHWPVFEPFYREATKGRQETLERIKKAFMNERWEAKEAFPGFIEYAISKGFDGYANVEGGASAFGDSPITEKAPGGVRTWAVFRPTQVKSATGNSGQFSNTDSDIRNSSRRGQVDTPEFKQWFGNSKIVDDDGAPLVVYHGTTRDFDVFKRGRWPGTLNDLGHWFSNLPADAEKFAKGDGGNLMPVYVKMERPLYIDSVDELQQLWREHTGSPSFREGADEFREWARGKGHDGIALDGKDIDPSFALGSYLVAFEPTQIKSAIGNKGTFDPNDPDIRNAPRRNTQGAVIHSVWSTPPDAPLLFGKGDKDSLIWKLQDKNIDMKRMVEAVKATGAAIADRFNPYLAEETYWGRSAKAAKDFLDNELNPLLREMQARKVEIGEFEEYLQNRHAEERNDQVASIGGMADGGSGIKTADARKYLAGLDPAKRRNYKALAKRIDAMTKGTRDLWVAGGLEKRETVDAMEATYKYYVPLNRKEFEDQGPAGTGMGYSVRGPASKRAMGSDKEVGNIIANIARQRETSITRAEKGRVGAAVYGFAIKHPNPDFFIPINPAGEKDPQKLVSELIAMGMDPADVQNIAAEPRDRMIDPNSGMIVERINAALRGKDNVLALRVNGEDRFVIFNTQNERAMRMVRTLKGLDADHLEGFMGAMATVTRWMGAMMTQYNPVFGVVNFLRDFGAVQFNLTSTPLAGKQAEVSKHVLSALRGIYIDLRDHRAGKTPNSSWAQLFEDFQQAGGQTGYKELFRTPKDRAKALTNEIDILNENAFKAGGRWVFRWLSDYNEAIENSIRLATYKVALDQGMTKPRAASMAKNITVNFNRKGQVATHAGALYAFFNAATQGTARLTETLKGPAGKKIIAGGVLLGVMQALALAFAGFDDEDPPEFVKDRSLVVPIGDGKYLSWPMPLGLHVLPAVGRRSAEFVMRGFKKPDDFVVGLFNLFAEAFNPVGGGTDIAASLTPTPFDPAVALLRNKDWTGKPIYKEDRNQNDPTPGFTRAKDTATAWSKWMAEAINEATGGTEFKPGRFSPTPDQIDYLIQQAFGGVGREISKLGATTNAWATGEDLPTYKVPLVGRFYGDSKQAAAESGRFYENLRQINMHEAEIKGRRENGQGATVSEYLREYPEARLITVANATERQVQELRKLKRTLIEKDASPERVKLVDERIKLTMKRLNDRVRELEEQVQ